MLAYKREDFAALARRREIARWAAGGIIDGIAAETLRSRFPQPFHSPNLFFRIGLFVFGLVCASAGLGLFFLMGGAQTGRIGAGFLLVLFGAGCLGLAESLARRDPKPFFRAGLEEAACYFGLGCLVSGGMLLAGFKGDPHAGLALWIGALLALAAIRYVDGLLAVSALACAVFAVLDLGRGLGAAGVYLLPPVIIAAASALAWASGRGLKAAACLPWVPVLSLLRLAALLLAYAGGNYFVVRELGGALLGGSGGNIPFAGMFYAYTFAVPIGYIARGLRKQDRLCLDAGLAATAAAVLTYKAYHNVISIETGLTLAGLALLSLSGIALRALRRPRFGLTSAPDKASAGPGLLDAESLLAWNTFGGQGAQGKAPEGMRGGGGGFGGGGAQGNF